MTSKRLHLVLLSVIGLLCVALIAGTYGINGLLTNQANKLITLKAKSQALAQEQLSLNQAKKDISKYADLEKIAQQVVPEDKNQAEAVREIVNFAQANNVALASITFPASTLGSTSATGAATGTSTTTAPKTVAPPSATSKSSVLSQLQPVPNIPGVYLLLINITSDPNNPVGYDNFINFLSNLEHDRRTAQVSTITLQPDTNNPNLLTFTLALNEYIKP